MKLKMENGAVVNDVEFAANNSIDGRLTIGISGVDLGVVYPILSNQNILYKIEYMTDAEEVVGTFTDYIILSTFSVNPDANNMIFWLRKRG